MITLEKPSENLGGLLTIWAVPPSDILVSQFNVEILSTENILEFYHTPETMEFSEQDQSTDAGLSFDVELTAFIPKQCVENQVAINLLQGRKWIVIFLDQNENYRVVGTNQIPMRFSCQATTGKAIADLNGQTITFHSKQLKRSMLISNPF